MKGFFEFANLPVMGLGLRDFPEETSCDGYGAREDESAKQSDSVRGTSLAPSNILSVHLRFRK
jgi:hypothetical protein